MINGGVGCQNKKLLLLLLLLLLFVVVVAAALITILYIYILYILVRSCTSSDWNRKCDSAVKVHTK